jgi:integrase
MAAENPAILTKQKIDRMTYAGGWDVRWDVEVTGLGLRVYPSGKKSFVVSYRTKGAARRKHLMVLGSYGVLTLKQARDMAKSVLTGVIHGHDPLTTRRLAGHSSRIAEVLNAYIERYAKPHKKTWAEDARRLSLHVPKRWLSLTPAELTREHVRALHTQIGADTPYEANRVLALLRVVFRFAKEEGFLPENAINPATEIKPYRERSRSRFATKDEIQALVRAIDDEPNIFIRALVLLYLQTAARKGELLERRWEDVELDRARLRLPDTKTGEEQFIPLTKTAIAILGGLPKLEGNPHIFPGVRAGGHLVNVSKAWARLLQRAGLRDLRLHDLRRTVGSWMTQAGTDLNAVKDALRHRNLGTTLIYARLKEEQARDALDQHSERLEGVIGSMRLVK